LPWKITQQSSKIPPPIHPHWELTDPSAERAHRNWLWPTHCNEPHIKQPDEGYYEPSGYD
jgi:hypothetical protein